MNTNSLIKNPVPYLLAGVLLAFIEPVRQSIIGLALGIPIFLFAYFASEYKDEEPKTSESEIGDNCYLIGFIYTLTVITVTLFLDSSEIAGIEGTAERQQLLATIGIALGTSVIGMALRMWFHHQGMDKLTQLDDNLSRVNDQAWKLKQVFGDLNETTIEANNELKSYSDTLKDETEKLLTEFRDALSKLPEEINEKFQATMDAIFEQVKENLDAILAKHLEASSKIYEDTLSLFRQMISESEVVKDRLTALIDSLNGTITMLQKLREELRAEGLKQGIQMIQATLNDLAKASADLTAEVSKLAKANGEQATIVNNATKKIEVLLKQHIATLGELEEQLKEQYSKTKELAEEESVKLYKSLLALADNAKRVKS